MNRLLKWIKRTPILIPFFILLFFYTPSALLLPPEVDRNAIVTSVGIDKEGEDYSLSFLRFVPQANSNYAEKLEVISTSGKNVSQNLEKASVIMGKNINLNHVESIILGSSILEEDISKILDFFVRAPIVLDGCLVCATNGEAKEVITMAQSLNDGSGMKIEDIVRYAEVNYYGRETTLETFFSGYYSPTKTSLISYIEVIDGESDGIGSGSSSSESGGENASEGQNGNDASSGSASGQGESKKEKLLANQGKLVLMKEGKEQKILSREDMAGLNYVKSNTGKAMLTVSDYDLGNGKLADVIYEVIENKTITDVDFSNNCPVVKFHVEMKLDLFEIIDKVSDEKQSIKQYDIDDEITDEIEKVVKREFAKAVKVLRETKSDAIGLYELMQKSDRKKFERFLSSLSDKNDFMSHIVFAISVESDPF